LLLPGISRAKPLVIISRYLCVVSYSVSQRIGEIGVRLALGAQPSNVFRMILRQSMMPTIGLGTLSSQHAVYCGFSCMG
jgi:hypothetical protein